MPNTRRRSSILLTKPSKSRYSEKGKIAKEAPKKSGISNCYLSGDKPLPPAFTYNDCTYYHSLLKDESKKGRWANFGTYRCAGNRKPLAMKATIAYNAGENKVAQQEPEMLKRASEVTGGAVIKVLATAKREQNGGMWYAIIMPHERMTLDAYLDAFPKLDVPRRKAILLEIAQALEKLALHDIIHCDIKGDNVLMKENGKPVIIDLGLGCDLKRPLKELKHFGPADHFGLCCNFDLYGGYKDENHREVIEWVRILLPIASGESLLGTSGDDILQCHLDELDAFVEIHGKFIFAQRDIYMLGVLALYVMFGNWQDWFTELKTMYPTPENIREIAAEMYKYTSYRLTHEEALESAEIVLNMCTPNLEERKNENWFIYKCKGGHASVGRVF